MTALPKRQLGRTGLQVTMLGYGAMELHGAPRGREVTETQAETILHAVLDAGINYIDTSIDYGVSEERIGRYIAERRSAYYLTSQCGCLVGALPAPRAQRSPHVFTRDNILAGVEQSLVRMQTDYLDVLQFHISPSRQTLEIAMLDYQPNIVLSEKEYAVVGTRPIRPDGIAKVTGRATYGADIRLPGMLYGKILRSPYAHARIKSIDTCHAEELPGVYATMTAADLVQPSGRLVDLAEGVQHNMRFLSNPVHPCCTNAWRHSSIAPFALVASCRTMTPPQA